LLEQAAEKADLALDFGWRSASALRYALFLNVALAAEVAPSARELVFSQVPATED